MTELGVKQWLAIRKEAGLKIDPETAEVDWKYAQTLDPYGIDPDLPEELRQVGREYFARSPGSDIWVHFGDLPEETRDALWSCSPNDRPVGGARRILRRLLDPRGRPRPASRRVPRPRRVSCIQIVQNNPLRQALRPAPMG